MPRTPDDFELFQQAFPGWSVTKERQGFIIVPIVDRLIFQVHKNARPHTRFVGEYSMTLHGMGEADNDCIHYNNMKN